MNNVFLFHGPNNYLIREKIKELVQDEEVIKYDLSESSLDEVMEDAMTVDLFSNNKIIIAKNADFFGSGVNEINFDNLYNFLKGNDATVKLIFTSNLEKLDERKKIVKMFHEHANVVACPNYNENMVKAFVRKNLSEYNISINEVNLIVNRLGTDLDIVANELEKLKLCVSKADKITKELIEDVISRTFNDNVFDLVNAVVANRGDEAIEIYQDLILLGNDPVNLTTLLVNQFRLIYQVKKLVKRGMNDYDMAKYLGVHAYPVKLAREQNYSDAKLIELMKQLINIEIDIKTGNISKDLGLELFLLKL